MQVSSLKQQQIYFGYRTKKNPDQIQEKVVQDEPTLEMPNAEQIQANLAPFLKKDIRSNAALIDNPDEVGELDEEAALDDSQESDSLEEGNEKVYEPDFVPESTKLYIREVYKKPCFTPEENAEHIDKVIAEVGNIKNLANRYEELLLSCYKEARIDPKVFYEKLNSPEKDDKKVSKSAADSEETAVAKEEVEDDEDSEIKDKKAKQREKVEEAEEAKAIAAEEAKERKERSDYAKAKEKISNLDVIYSKLAQEYKLNQKSIDNIDNIRSQLISADGAFIAERNKIIEGNLRLAIHIAKHYANNGILFNDLLQIGNEGLMKAAECYKKDKGTIFATFACNCIARKIEREFKNQKKTIRIPVYLEEVAYKYTKAYPALVAKLDRNPTDEEMSEEIGEPLSRIKRIRLLPVVDSFEKPVVNSSKKLKDNSTVGTIIEDAYVDTSGNAHTRPAEELLKNAQLSHIVRVAYKCLNDNEKLVMEGRFPQEGHQKTLEQLARELSVTQERIRQIEAKALEKIEKALKQTLGEDNFSKNDKKEAGKEVQNLVKLIDKCDNLTEIEKYILEKRHAVNGKKMTLAEIQNEKGLYPRNVYTIEQSAFKKLKKTAERIKESDTI